MTAVAPSSSFQSLSRIGWDSSSSKSNAGGLNGAAQVGDGDFTRTLNPRKGSLQYGGSYLVDRVATVGSEDSTGRATEQVESPIDPGVGTTLLLARPQHHQESEGLASAKSARRNNNNSWGIKIDVNSGALANGRASTISSSSSSSSLVPTPMVPSLVTARDQPNSQTASTVLPQKQMQTHPPPPQQLNGGRMAVTGPPNSDPPVLLVLLPLNGTFERKQITVPYFPDILRIGRQTNARTVPTPVNGYFDSKVLSRQHAEVWADRSGKVWIRDVKSSNGTFVNGVRLSPESRDSEPHELRETDTLELGIDIVSEDQKSIVHHKVSAKIEHAGIQTNASSVLDLNLGDIDPGSGGGLMGGLLPQGHLRGRTGSQGSMISNGSRMSSSMGGNMGVMGVQRHVNAWLTPVSIEQVVKKLGSELKLAKQQAQDLHRTSDFFNAILNSQPGEDLPKPPTGILPAAPHTNGVKLPRKVDPLSPFLQPPAPPPQQPLPEKPDSAGPAGAQSLLTNDTNMPHSLSPSRSDHSSSASQILTLAEALAAARKELDNQGNKMRYLEEMLRQERRARENAEYKAQMLMEQSRIQRAAEEHVTNGTTVDQEFPDPFLPDEDEADSASVKTLKTSGEIITIGQAVSEGQPNGPSSTGEKIVSSESILQGRLDLAMIEMDEIKQQMESYKRRAESAEEERTSLAEMVQRIRQENSEAALAAAAAAAGTATANYSAANGKQRLDRSTRGQAHDLDDSDEDDGDYASANGSVSEEKAIHALGKSATFTQEQSDRSSGGAGASTTSGALKDSDKSRQMQLLHRAFNSAAATAFQDDTRVIQVAPYASLVGVVLIGVGIMAYLNGWQGRTER